MLALHRRLCALIPFVLGLLCVSSNAQVSLFQRASDPIPAKLEAQYIKGLKFLVKNQTKEGCWPDSYGRQPGVTGLCAVAMLAHGEDPNFGPYAEPIRNALDFVIKQQNATNGYIGNSMYNHGFATLALAEAYGSVKHPKLGPALRKAVDLILDAQKKNPRGGWRYSPTTRDADTTVSGAQMVALFAARNAGVAIPDTAFERGLEYFNKMRDSRGSYGYTSKGSGNHTRTAIGALVFALAKQKNEKHFEASIKYLTANLNHRETHYTYYFEYYMSQALFHGDFESWKKWNEINMRFLFAAQAPDGSWPGSYGQSFSTSAALLSLALNYRFLPIYER